MARMLVIDDDARGRRRLRAELERLGHDVAEATDTAAALTAYRTGRIDVVVTNIFMPQKDGLEVVRLLRREDPDLPIVALSAGPSLDSPAPEEAARGAMADDVVELAREFGATWVLGSPFDWTDFRDAIAAVLPPRLRRARGSRRP